MKYLFVLIILSSCATTGINYNTSRTHNGQIEARFDVISRNDSNSKKQMKKLRKQAERSLPSKKIKTKKRKIVY